MFMHFSFWFCVFSHIFDIVLDFPFGNPTISCILWQSYGRAERGPNLRNSTLLIVPRCPLHETAPACCHPLEWARALPGPAIPTGGPPRWGCGLRSDTVHDMLQSTSRPEGLPNLCFGWPRYWPGSARRLNKICMIFCEHLLHFAKNLDFIACAP